MAKLYRPDDTARALQAAGLPGHRRLVRAGAAGEVMLAAVAIAVPGPVTGALVASAYAAFSVFVAVAVVRKWPLSSCGCFGRPDARPGYQHLLLDVVAAAAAVGWALSAPTHIGSVFVQSPGRGFPLGLIATLIAGLAYLVWTNPLQQALR